MVWLAYSNYHGKYHGTWETKEEAEKCYVSGLEVTAGNLAENELEDDWESYYKTKDEALKAGYEDILDQLKSETEYVEVTSTTELQKLKGKFEDNADYEEALEKLKG